jgi:hypothetical protein
MKTLYNLFLILIILVFASCAKLTDLNVNPNGIDPSVANPNLIVPTAITLTAQPYLNDNYRGNVAGVMQYVQFSGWSSGVNRFDWISEASWAGPYNTLRILKHLNERAVADKMEFQQGLAIVLRAFNFGYITDGWGDAPYSKALKGDIGGQEDLFPVFDAQEDIYKGIIEELKTANTLLSKTESEYSGINKDVDLIYGGSPSKWRKMANSLRLRYYMRVSAKLPDYAKAGIEGIISDPAKYPIFSSSADDATMGYVGAASSDSWPANTLNDLDATNTIFSRIQMCAGLRDVLLDYQDPRIAVWFKKVNIPIKVSTLYPQNDVIVGGIRYLRPEYMAAKQFVVYNKNTWPADVNAGKTLVDTLEYVGIPTASQSGENVYNLNPNTQQGGFNDHVSALADKYKSPIGPMLRARLISYTEICFILAESAKKGWNVGSQQTWYEKGVKASLELWGVGTSYNSYIAVPGVAYNASLDQIIIQKWIANWNMAFESWCDWRRTGLPKLSFGTRGRRLQMPIRFRYDANDKSRNATNYNAAAAKLVPTAFTSLDGNDSAWSKMWLLQGSNIPY